MTVGKFYPTTPLMVGLVVELLRSSRAQRLVTCGKSLALWIWTGKRNNQNLGEIQVRERTLEYLFNVLIITMFCYCWSLFFSRQKKVHRRSTQLGVWEQYRCIRCMDVDINKETIQWLLHSVAGVLDAKTCRAKYKFKIENVTQLLEFHALSDHQTLKKPTISICLLVNFFGQINEPSGINCLMKYTVCLSMSLLNLNDRSLINTARTVLFLDHMWSVNVFVFKVEDDENVFETHVIV